MYNIPEQLKIYIMNMNDLHQLLRILLRLTIDAL
jgi:hypothetical protein